MNIFLVVGARPQFIKAAPLVRALRRAGATCFLLHTGQHYDPGLSQVFFEELELAPPDLNLNAGSGSHAGQTAAMLAGIEGALIEQRPDWVVVFGDTNSTLAGALAAAKLGMPVCHVEAGLRSFNRAMPEEINRVVADSLSRMLLCPSPGAVENLHREGIRDQVHLVGDIMADALVWAQDQGCTRSVVLERWGLREKAFLLATVHRAVNTDDPIRLAAILQGLAESGEMVVVPLHPRTRARLAQFNLTVPAPVMVTDPVGYLDMVRLQSSARLIVTDSGGVQKEAYWLRTGCLTLREETEWPETVATGWNRLVPVDPVAIVQAIRSFTPPADHPPLYGDGHTAARITGLLLG